METNNLIAKFMDLEYAPEGSRWDDWFDIDRYRVTYGTRIPLQYDTSWEWLMPVVEKIRKCKCYDRGDVFNYQFIIHNNKVEYYAGGYTKKPSKFFNGSDIEAVYKAVLEFIKDYNNGIN